MVYSDCPSMSMKPGATTFPRASMVRERCAPLRLPMEAIFPARIPISPEYQGEPVPSMTWPLGMNRSEDWAGWRASKGATPRSKITERNTDFHCRSLPLVIRSSLRPRHKFFEARTYLAFYMQLPRVFREVPELRRRGRVCARDTR